MRQGDFSPIADDLRDEILAWYHRRGERLEGPAGLNTLETNSGYVERRAAPLLAMLRRYAGVDSLHDLEVADLGCGFGAITLYLAAWGARVTGIDPNGSRFEVGQRVASRHGLQVRFQRTGMQAPDLPAARFHLAIQNNSLCYVVPRLERRLALHETLRLLRRGGWVLQRNPNRWHPVDQFTGLPLFHLLPPESAGRVSVTFGRDRSAVRLLSPLAARRELRRAGFVEVRVVSSTPGTVRHLLRPAARYQHLLARRPR